MFDPGNMAETMAIDAVKEKARQFFGSGLGGVDALARTWKLQRKYMFDVQLPDLPGVPGIGVSQYCQAVKFGQYDMTEVAKIRYGAFQKSYAGFFELKQVQAVFLKPVPDIVSTYFAAWKGLIIDDQGFHFPKQNYAKTVFVKVFDRTGKDSGNFRLTGVFPVVFPAHDLSYVEEELVQFQIEFSVDRVYTI